ncbi:hypothetical protein J2X06_000591 [Lysobacter niastensis]|uniref:Uncharacterized protein n=1 Tax=Lysobacter niastensis TaxID=380629 RepID=A0ABU1W741_9GAMM|nr:hypothetical protein [Lysobacter niastensis]
MDNLLKLLAYRRLTHQGASLNIRCYTPYVGPTRR